MKSGCIISYARFIRSGYSVHLEIGVLDSQFKRYFQEFEQNCQNKRSFYSLMAIAIGLMPNDFKFGQNALFFRQSKSAYFNCLFTPNEDSISMIINKMRQFLRITEKWQAFYNRIMSLAGTFSF